MSERIEWRRMQAVEGGGRRSRERWKEIVTLQVSTKCVKDGCVVLILPHERSRVKTIAKQIAYIVLMVLLNYTNEHKVYT